MELFPEFAHDCVYLDIETTGLSTVFDTITMVGLYDGRRYQLFVDGENLQDLPKHLQKYSLVVTFNGSGFDLRFLKLMFPDMALPPIHIDLRWAMRKLGMKGGLKSIEAALGLRRPSEIEDLTGYDATVLWAKYLRGDKHALQSLIQYNTEDVVHLKAIMEVAYDRLSMQTAEFLKEKAKLFLPGSRSSPKREGMESEQLPQATPAASLGAYSTSA